MSNLASRISVIIPLYNKEQHIERTLDSILSQTHSPFEIVVIDDGSTDESATLVETYESSKVRLIRQENQGVSMARNNGIKAATGDYVAFIDADDSWDRHFLEEINTLINFFPSASVYTTGYQFIVGGDRYVDPKIRPARPIERPRLLNDFFEIGSKGALPFMMSSFCARRSAFDYFGYFPVGEPMGEDQDVFAKAAITCDIAYSPRILSFYHLDADNRACIANPPKEECPFSRRLHNWAQQYEKEEARKEAMIDYTAAHLLNVASQNIRLHKFNVAKKLLSDPRCKRLTSRYIWWRLNLFINQCRQAFA